MCGFILFGQPKFKFVLPNWMDSFIQQYRRTNPPCWLAEYLKRAWILLDADTVFLVIFGQAPLTKVNGVINVCWISAKQGGISQKYSSIWPALGCLPVGLLIQYLDGIVSEHCATVNKFSHFVFLVWRIMSCLCALPFVIFYDQLPVVAECNVL